VLAQAACGLLQVTLVVRFSRSLGYVRAYGTFATTNCRNHGFTNNSGTECTYHSRLQHWHATDPVNVASGRRPYSPRALTANLRSAGSRVLCSGWCGRRRLANRRVTARAPQDLVPGTKCGTRRIQDVGTKGAREDVEGRGLERFHGGEWNELHTDRAIFCCAV
jgi:hypothetical protein